jgi:hypothetical protein
MAITDKIVYDSITILEDGQMQVRRTRVILDTDLSEVSRTFFRTVLEPGQDVASYPARVRALCAFVWTPAVIAAYEAAKAARLAAFPSP